MLDTYILIRQERSDRGKLNCVGLALINAIVSHKTAGQRSMEYGNQQLYFN